MGEARDVSWHRVCQQGARGWGVSHMGGLGATAFDSSASVRVIAGGAGGGCAVVVWEGGGARDSLRLVRARAPLGGGGWLAEPVPRRVQDAPRTLGTHGHPRAPWNFGYVLPVKRLGSSYVATLAKSRRRCRECNVTLRVSDRSYATLHQTVKTPERYLTVYSTVRTAERLNSAVASTLSNVERCSKVETTVRKANR